jgi:hypothetical protein
VTDLGLVFRFGEGGFVGDGDAAGAEADVEIFVGVDRADCARRQLGARLRPAHLAVEPDLVLVVRGGLEILEADQRVVVALDPEGLLAAAEDLDLAGPARLDPDRRLGVRDVAQQGSQDELAHGPPRTQLTWR